MTLRKGRGRGGKKGVQRKTAVLPERRGRAGREARRRAKGREGKERKSLSVAEERAKGGGGGEVWKEGERSSEGG